MCCALLRCAEGPIHSQKPLVENQVCGGTCALSATRCLGPAGLGWGLVSDCRERVSLLMSLISSAGENSCGNCTAKVVKYLLRWFFVVLMESEGSGHLKTIAFGWVHTAHAKDRNPAAVPSWAHPLDRSPKCLSWRTWHFRVSRLTIRQQPINRKGGKLSDTLFSSKIYLLMQSCSPKHPP